MLTRRKYLATVLNGWSAAALLFFAGLMLYASAGRDDVFKTLFPAYTLSEFGQILNYNGEAIEQSSSLLQVLLLGMLHRLFGGDIVQMGSLLAVLCGMATVMYSPLVGRQLGLSEEHSRWAPWLLAGSSLMTYWAWGGLDASLAALCMILFLDGARRFFLTGKVLFFSLASLAFLLVRPENGLIALLALCLLAIYAWRNRDAHFSRGKVGKAAMLILGLVMGIFLLRYGLFGALFPLPVQAKAGLSASKIYRGATYFFWQMWFHPEFLLLVLSSATSFVLLWRKKQLGGVFLVAALLLASAAFVLASGGDWMENGRFFVPLLPLFILIFLFGLPHFPPLIARILPFTLLLFSCYGHLHTARYHSTGQPFWQAIKSMPPTPGHSFAEKANRVHRRDLEMCVQLRSVVAQLYAHKQAPVTLLSQQAGMVIFHTAKSHFRKLQFIDLVSLSTPDFLECNVTRARGATYGGLNMDLYYLFEDLKNLRAQCGFSPPDIIFDLDNERHEKEEWLLQNGYFTYYRREGKMEMGSEWFPGLEIGAEQILMIRADLLGVTPKLP